MSFRQKLGLNISPILLRLALGVTFIYAGAGKVTQMAEFEGERAALLANMGVQITPTGFAPATPEIVVPPVEAPEETPEEVPITPPVEEVEGEAVEPPAAQMVSNGRVFTSADFPTPARARAVHNITLMIYDLTHPAAGVNALLPAALGDGKRPMMLAWIAGVTELLGGVFVLVGLAGRFWSFMLAGVMVGALWMTQIGPVVMGNMKGTLGFLPELNMGDPGAWQMWLWQFALLTSALAVTLLGSGTLSFDRLLFGSAPPPAARAPARQHPPGA